MTATRPDLAALLAQATQQVSGGDVTTEQCLLTTEEVARMLRLDPSTLRRWRTACPVQGPPFVRISERVTVYRPEDVAQWLLSRRTVPTAA